jgi:fucose permease
MTTDYCADRPAPGIPQQIATRVTFFVAGFGMSAWAPLVPFVKARLAIDEASLGLLLLCIGAGSMLGMPLTGVLTGRLGCRWVILLAAALICLDLPLLAVMESQAGMAVALLLFGAAIGMLDVSMNIHAVLVEKASGRAMMSGFHGFFSIGSIAGALGVSALLWLKLSPLLAAVAVVAVMVLLMAPARRHLWPQHEQQAGPLLVLPRGWVVFLGFLCFVMFLLEGSMLDWGALFLIGSRGVAPEHAGIGYAAFSVAMTLGRLNGDRIVQALGRFRVLLFGSLCAGAGLLLAILAPGLLSALAGFVLVGIGAANLVPIMFSAAGNQTAMPANLAIASVTTLGYAGILAGPALIGFIAQLSNLSVAFACVAALMLVVTASARFVTR